MNNTASHGNIQTASASQNGATSTMTHAEAIAKVAKLLRLAQSNNPHEAALAASRAQEIMDRFKLQGGDISLDGEAKPNEPVQHFVHDPLDVDGSALWKGRLGVTIAKQNQCKLYKSGGTTCLIGRASDVNAVRYIYAWLVREIDRLAERDCKGCGRTYWNNFRHGAVETVCNRLRASAKEVVSAVRAEAVAKDSAIIGSHALMIVEKSLATIAQQEKEVEDYGREKLNLRKASASRTQFHSGARDAGRRAGGEVRMGNHGALSGGYKRLN